MNPTRNTLGQIVRALRVSREMNQEQLAKRLGVVRQQISQIELGQSGLHNDNLIQRVADVFKIDVATLKAARAKKRICQKKRGAPMADFITSLRVEQGLNQRQLARLAGLCLETIRKAEQNARRTRGKTLSRILEALKYKIPPGFALR